MHTKRQQKTKLDLPKCIIIIIIIIIILDLYEMHWPCAFIHAGDNLLPRHANGKIILDPAIDFTETYAVSIIMNKNNKINAVKMRVVLLSFRKWKSCLTEAKSSQLVSVTLVSVTLKSCSKLQRLFLL